MNPRTSAFPITQGTDDKYYTGLTKRQYLAAMAMQGMAGHFAGFSDSHADRIATIAVEIADSLIKALGEEK